MLPERVQNWFSFKFAQRSRYVVIYLFLGFQHSSFIISTVSVSGLYSPYSFVAIPVSSLALVNVLNVSKLMFYPLKHFKLSSACWKHFFPPHFSPSPKTWFLTVQSACIYTLNSKAMFIYFVHTSVSLFISQDQIPQFSLNLKNSLLWKSFLPIVGIYSAYTVVLILDV